MSNRLLPRRPPRTRASRALACAVLVASAAAGCASGAPAAVDAARERPPRPDTGVAEIDAAIERDGGATERDGGATGSGGLDSGGLDSGGLDSGALDSGAVLDARASDAGSRCCTTSSDCAAAEVCVVLGAGEPGVCERALVGSRDCWTDADCTGTERCGGTRIRACTEPRGIFDDDSPGRCR